MTLTYFLNLLVLLGWVWLLWKKSDTSIGKPVFWLGLSFKVLCGISLGLLYRYHYGEGDTLAYFSDVRTMSSWSSATFWDYVFSWPLPSQSGRAILFTKIIAVLTRVTHADYWLCSIYLSVVSFSGAWYLVNQFSKWKKEFELPAILTYLFFPSIIFWSSGLLKESLVFGCMCLLMGGYVKFRAGAKFLLFEKLILVLSVVLIAYLKYYVAAVFIPVVLFLVIYHLMPKSTFGVESPKVRGVMLAIVMVIPVYFFVQFLSPNFRSEHILSVIQENHDRMINLADNQDMIPSLAIFDNELDHLINSLYYMFSGIFRPLFPEQMVFPNVFSAVENLMILTISFFTLFNLKKYVKIWSIELISCLFYCSVLAILLCYSLPNFGTIARMKVYYMPLLLFLILIPHSARLKIPLQLKK